MAQDEKDPFKFDQSNFDPFQGIDWGNFGKMDFGFPSMEPKKEPEKEPEKKKKEGSGLFGMLKKRGAEKKVSTEVAKKETGKDQFSFDFNFEEFNKQFEINIPSTEDFFKGFGFEEVAKKTPEELRKTEHERKLAEAEERRKLLYEKKLAEKAARQSARETAAAQKEAIKLAKQEQKRRKKTCTRAET